MIHRAYFTDLEAATEHARKFGGWIALGNDGAVQWFDAARWTHTPVLAQLVQHGGGRTLTYAEARALLDSKTAAAG